MTTHGRRLPLASLPATSTDPAAAGITRRSALQGLAAGLGLAVGVPAEAHEIDHPLAAHVAQRRTTAPSPKATPHAPQFLDAHQFATLSVIADLIVPGAVASGSPAYIDDVLAVEHDDVRRTFVSALAAVDRAARDGHGTTFRMLPAAQQPVLLEGLTGPLATLKPWVAGAHYSSETGMKELGFTGAVFFQTFPACPHPEGHE